MPVRAHEPASISGHRKTSRRTSNATCVKYRRPRPESRLAELLRVVEHGESIAVTRHAQSVAHPVPAGDRERASRKEAVEDSDAQCVDEGEMAEILNDDALVGGCGPARARPTGARATSSCDRIVAVLRDR